MSSHTLDRTFITPSSPVALSWTVVEHETPYTLQYRDGVPYIFGPAGDSSFQRNEPVVVRRSMWRIFGLAGVAAIFAFTILLPIAFAATSDKSSAKSPMELANIASKLDALSASQGSTSITLVNERSREIAAYKDPKAYSTLSGVAASGKDSVLSANADGSLIYYSKSSPEHVYFAYPNLPYQFEIFDPTPGTSLTLAKTPDLIDGLI